MCVFIFFHMLYPSRIAKPHDSIANNTTTIVQHSVRMFCVSHIMISNTRHGHTSNAFASSSRLREHNPTHGTYRVHVRSLRRAIFHLCVPCKSRASARAFGRPKRHHTFASLITRIACRIYNLLFSGDKLALWLADDSDVVGTPRVV